MRPAVALIMAWTVLAGPTAAQEFAVEAGAVRACFAGTATGDAAPRCLGAASDACQAGPGGSTTVGIASCITAETAVWDDILNEEYAATRRAFDGRSGGPNGGPLNDALRDAQRAWIAFRDADCALAFERWADGTIRSVVHANCMMVLTAERALALRDMRDGG